MTISKHEKFEVRYYDIDSVVVAVTLYSNYGATETFHGDKTKAVKAFWILPDGTVDDYCITKEQLKASLDQQFNEWKKTNDALAKALPFGPVAKDYNPETGFQPQHATIVVGKDGPTVGYRHGGVWYPVESNG
jgi:hypothetical protein